MGHLFNYATTAFGERNDGYKMVVVMGGYFLYKPKPFRR
jgi:hypothetical protein